MIGSRTVTRGIKDAYRQAWAGHTQDTQYVNQYVPTLTTAGVAIGKALSGGVTFNAATLVSK